MQNPYLAWKHKLEVNVADYSTTKDFLANVVLVFRPGMRAAFQDIRASSRNGTKISYFTETITEFNQTFIWFKLPKGTDFFYIHYGNGGVASESDGKKVFTFFDHFDKLDATVWKTIAGSATVSGSILTLQNTSQSSVLESNSTFSPNTLVEIRAQYPAGNRTILGYRNYSTQKAAAWQNAAASDANNQRFAHNGTTGNWDTDGVNRSGSTYYVYGVAHLVAGPLYYVNYAYRGTITDYIPGNVSLPIQFYCYSNTGAFKVDWVRVRDYETTMPTLTAGRKFTTQPKGYPWDNAISAVNTRMGMYPTVSIKSFLGNINTQIGMKASVMFRRPLFYNPQLRSPYPNWKYAGEINIGDQTSPARVKLPILPGMGLDGRDLRYTDLDDNELGFNIFDNGADYLDCWVGIHAGTTRIKFYYGNGIAETKSNPAIVGTPDTETIVTVTPNIGGGGGVWLLPGWKYQGDINLSATSSTTGGEQILLSIPLLPGMTVDGRDLRFLDRDGNKLSYYLESSTASEFSVWVKLPALHDKIFLCYGNGIAVSESSASSTFDLYDDFLGTSLGSEWTITQGTATVNNSLLTIASTTLNSLVRGASTFGPGSIVEMMQYHALNNQMINGFNCADNRRIAWLGASGANNNDYAHTHNGSTTTSTSDAVDRSGTTFFNYGCSYESGSAKFYINDALRQTVATNVPTGNLNVGFYSEVNSGNVVLDWVRVRKITTITGTIGRRKSRTGPVYYETNTETVIEHIPEVQITHRPQWKTSQIYYEYLKLPSSFMGMVPGEPTFKERRELADYAFVSCDVSMSINDAYIQLSTEFQNLTVPPEGSTIKHNAYDSAGNPHLIFQGKILTSSPTHGKYSQTVKMQAADNSINLVTQPIPWNYQVIDTEVDSVPIWINRLLEPEKTGVYPNTIIDTYKEPKQFVFDPKVKKLEAIKKIAEYAGCMYQTRLVTREIDGYTITRPEFYLVPPDRIDEPVNGFDLPDPLILNAADCRLVSDPVVTNESEEKYNSVLVYGVLSENGETVVAQASSYEVYTGDQKPQVYPIQDNTITEKGSTAEREAIKWLLYFLSKRVKVALRFVDRFDLELYQRVRFGEGFSDKLKELTDSVQVQQIAAFDPRDAANSTHLIDVSGVPRPRWLRISDIKQTSEHRLELINVTAITDFIYSVVDPVVPTPYSDYLSPGYYKPIIENMIDTTQSIVNDNIEKQLTPETCTVLSINEEEKTAVVQTASGKLVTVSLA